MGELLVPNPENISLGPEGDLKVYQNKTRFNYTTSGYATSGSAEYPFEIKLSSEKEEGKFREINVKLKVSDGTDKECVACYTPKDKMLETNGVMINMGGIIITFLLKPDVESLKKYTEVVSENGFKGKLRQVIDQGKIKKHHFTEEMLALFELD